MRLLMILSAMLLIMISLNMATTTSMACISNVTIVLQANFISFHNVTYISCVCFVIQQNFSGFQYNANDSDCLTFDNITSISAIQTTPGSRVCFFMNITSLIQNSQTTTYNPPQSVTWYTSTTNGGNTVDEYIYLQNSVVLTFLCITVTVPRTSIENSPTLWDNCWANTVNLTINQNVSAFVYTFQLINGQSIVVGSWMFAIQFGLTISNRSTLNDTYYSIQTTPNGTIFVGYF